MLKHLAPYLSVVFLGEVLGLEPPLPGYSVGVIRWEMPVSPDGRVVTLDGTVQQVYHQLLEIDPGYGNDFAGPGPETEPRNEAGDRGGYEFRSSVEPGYEFDSAITARKMSGTAGMAKTRGRSSDRHRALAERQSTDLFCDTYPPAEVEAILDGISYLRGVRGSPGLGPAPGSCGQVSCSWDSAIWWCNDSNETKILPYFGDIANSAQSTVEKCRSWNGVGYKVAGQQFHADHWNTIVRKGEC